MKRPKSVPAEILVTVKSLEGDLAYLQDRKATLEKAGAPKEMIATIRRTVSVANAMLSYVRRAGAPVTFIEAALSARKKIGMKK